MRTGTALTLENLPDGFQAALLLPHPAAGWLLAWRAFPGQGACDHVEEHGRVDIFFG